MKFPHVIQGSEGDQFGDQIAPLFPVGQKMELPDNRIFRYAEMGGTTGEANSLYQSEVPTAHWVTQAITDWGETAHALQYGDTMVQLRDGTTAIAKAQEGSFICEETSDLGMIYFIKEQRVTASNETVVFLKDGVKIQYLMADTASNVTTFVKNPWMDILIHDSPPTAMPVGVPPSIIVEDNWGWCQTKGICSCLSDDTGATVVLGNLVRPCSDTDGALTGLDYTGAAADIGPIAWVAELAPTTEFGLFWLFLE